MARKKCDFIKGAKAAWFCEHCDACFSDSCIPEGYDPRWGKAGPVCILCHAPLIDARAPHLQLPFWQVLPYLLVYPLYWRALLLLLLGAGGVYLMGAGMAAAVFSGVYASLLVRYCFQVMDARAMGQVGPPSLLGMLKPDSRGLFWQLLGLLVLFAAGTWALAYWVDVRAAIGVGLLLGFLYPAITMALAAQKNLLKALNPLLFGSLVASMGLGPYVALVAMLAFVVGGLGALGYGVLMPYAGPWLWPTALLGLGYIALVVHALLGYAMFQYGLGGVSEQSAKAPLGDSAFARAKALGEVKVLEAAGELDRARQSLRGLLDICRDDIDLHRQYQKLLYQLDDGDALAGHTDYFADLLLRQGQNKEAVTLVEQARKHDSEYRINDLELAAPLSQALEKAGKHELMVSLVGNLHRRVAPDERVAEVYTRVAKALAGPLKQPQKARAVALYVVKTYPHSAGAGAIAKLARD